MSKASDMTNKLALVTGGASGLGLATARKFAEAGANVCLADVDAQALSKAVKALDSYGVEVMAYTVDLADSEQCSAVVGAAITKFGRLDVLCNIAGVMLPNHTATMPKEAFQKTLSVNLAAPFYLMQAALPHLLEAKGAIVNVASTVGITAQAYNAAYCATKAGLIHMTKSLAMEYMHKPIRINVVAPGGMMTPLALNMTHLEEPDPSLMARTSPLRGLVDIEEVADMVVFLGSDAAQGYHGSCIVIDNGMCAG